MDNIFVSYSQTSQYYCNVRGPADERYASQSAQYTYKNLKELHEYTQLAFQATNQNIILQHTQMRKHLQDRHYDIRRDIGEDIVDAQNGIGGTIINAQNALGQGLVDTRNQMSFQHLSH